MKLAIQHLQRQIKELEVQLDQANSGLKSLRAQVDAKNAEVLHLNGLIADLRSAVTVLPVTDLKSVDTGAESKSAMKRK